MTQRPRSRRDQNCHRSGRREAWDWEGRHPWLPLRNSPALSATLWWLQRRGSQTKVAGAAPPRSHFLEEVCLVLCSLTTRHSLQLFGKVHEAETASGREMCALVCGAERERKDARNRRGSRSASECCGCWPPRKAQVSQCSLPRRAASLSATQHGEEGDDCPRRERFLSASLGAGRPGPGSPILLSSSVPPGLSRSRLLSSSSAIRPPPFSSSAGLLSELNHAQRAQVEPRRCGAALPSI